MYPIWYYFEKKYFRRGGFDSCGSRCGQLVGSYVCSHEFSGSVKREVGGGEH